MGLPRHVLVVLSFFLCVHVHDATSSNPTKFLIVSTPRASKVSYMRIPSDSLSLKGSANAQQQMKTLIGVGLVHPQGIAVDAKRSLLLVADPDSKRIFAYPLSSDDTTLSVGDPLVFAEDVESRWVTVDTRGNAIFSDEPRNQILRIKHGQALKNTTPEVLFDGKTLSQVSAPGGVASDAFHSYWVNKQTGTQTGSLIQADVDHAAESSTSTAGFAAEAIAKNTDKSYGVCLSLRSIYYTQPQQVLFGIKKTGGSVVKITDRLENPRGCAWDGDGTVYVADRGANAVYSFPGNMPELSALELTRVVNYEDAFGVAVYSGAAMAQIWGSLLVCLSALNLARNDNR